MRRDEVLAVLRAHKSDLERFGVRSLALFGSVARDEAGPDSDLDLLIVEERSHLPSHKRATPYRMALTGIHPRKDIVVYTPAEIQQIESQGKDVKITVPADADELSKLLPEADVVFGAINAEMLARAKTLRCSSTSGSAP